MARGYFFCVTTDPDEKIRFSEEDYCGELDSIGCDYMQGLSPDEAEESARCLRETLGQLGAKICCEEDSPFGFAFTFSDVETMQMDYFAPKLETAAKVMAGMTLNDVIRGSFPSVDNILNNSYGDLIELHDREANGAYCPKLTFDDFIRQAVKGRQYYVAKDVILMH